MKKLIAIGMVSAVVLMGSGYAQAGQKEWATAGKILAGVAAVSVLSDLASRPGYTYYEAPCYRPVYTTYSRPYYRPYTTSYYSYPSVTTYTTYHSGNTWVHTEDTWIY